MSFVGQVARAAFDERRRRRPDLADLRRFYLDEIRASQRATFLGAMAAVYLESFDPGAPHTRELAEALSEVRDRLGARWRDLLAAIPEVFRPDAAPEAVARAMMAMPSPWVGLKALGLRSPHAPGLMDVAHLAYVARLEPSLATRDGLERLFAWLKPDGQATARSSGASEAIEAVLGHWTTVTRRRPISASSPSPSSVLRRSARAAGRGLGRRCTRSPRGDHALAHGREHPVLHGCRLGCRGQPYVGAQAALLAQAAR